MLGIQKQRSLDEKELESYEYQTEVTELHGLKIETERRRWFILLGFALLSFSNSSASSLYSLNVDEFEDYYKVGRTKFLWLSNIYYFLYIFLGIPFSSLLTKHFGLSMMISTSLNSLGGFLRWYGGNNYEITMIAQTLGGIAQCFILQAPGVVTEEWFATKERMWALLLATYAGFLGWVFGNVSPCLYIEYYPRIEAFRYIFRNQLIISLIPTIVLAMVIRDKPKHFPNVGAYIKTKSAPKSVSVVMRELFKNRDYINSMLCFGFATGVTYTIPTITAFFMDMKNYANIDQSYVGGAFLVTGIFGSLIGTLYLEMKKTSSYDLILKFCFFIGFVSVIALGIFKNDSRLWLIVALNGLAGLGYIALTPFAIESILETTFPLPESLSVGNSIIVGQIFGLILIYFTTLRAVGYQGFWILAAASIIPTVFMVFRFKTVFKRAQLEIEEEEASERESLLDDRSSEIIYTA